MIWKRLRLSKPCTSNFTGKKRRRRRGNIVGIAGALEVMTARASGCLTELDFEHVVPSPLPFKNADMLKIKDRAKNTLEVLKLHGSYCVNSLVILDVISACTKLRVLHAPSLTTMRCRMLRKIVQNCKHLEDINLERCDGFSCDASALAEALAPVRDTLRKINFSFTRIAGLPLLQFGYDFPKLEEIRADACRDLINFPYHEGVVAANGLFPNLTTFSVNGPHVMSKVNTFSLLPPPSTFPAEWVRTIFNTERKLRHFSMNCTPFTKLDVAFAGQLPCLTVLGLAGQDLTDEQWQQIFNTMYPTLEICDVRLNRKLTGTLRTETLGGKTFSQLVSLDFCGTLISDEAVRQIMQLAPKLETFRLHGCRSVLDRQLRRNPLGLKNPNTSTTEALNL